MCLSRLSVAVAIVIDTAATIELGRLSTLHDCGAEIMQSSINVTTLFTIASIIVFSSLVQKTISTSSPVTDAGLTNGSFSSIL